MKSIPFGREYQHNVALSNIDNAYNHIIINEVTFFFYGNLVKLYVRMNYYDKESFLDDLFMLTSKFI